MTEEQKLQIALFRFSLVAPILNNQIEDISEYLETLASQVHDVPYYGKREYNAKTIRIWFYDYKKGGLDALKPKGRKDKGSSRVISSSLGEKIISYRQENPSISVMLLYEQMVKDGLFLRSQISYHSVYRFLAKRNLAKPLVEQSSSKVRKKFAYDEVNHLWQGDMMVGPYLYVNGKRKPTYLFAFIDDCSRLVTFARFDVEQNFESMKSIYVEALLRRGIPQVVYLDNAKVYRSTLFHEACARMGTAISHTEPYDAASKGKIERFFRTVRDRFLPLIPKKPSSLEELNNAFLRWLEEDYHRRIHSALKISPLDKYMSQASKIKVVDDPLWVNNLFLKREKRKVNNDSTISLYNQFYEVSSIFIGKRVEVRFDPKNMDKVMVYENDEFLEYGKLVSLADNAIIKRDYSLDNPEQKLSFHQASTQKGDS
ncbi:DDE-type integrase/transposase/recombinase [Candidatus Syntrophocurvum alkaliphilum]|uniref:DDE-type integrase/transposase/recombinase n=1 Tax=Candidatus Syntrophocurvum alkaliphilum TaxID=2293317 RepID=UPI001FAA72E1|nr:DDE-type integrase/transposase/recombinase [Candidatus Syntrophocurvum alkaliphilum]